MLYAGAILNVDYRVIANTFIEWLCYHNRFIYYASSDYNYSYSYIIIF